MKEFKHEFKVDTATKTITFADKEFKSFLLLKKASDAIRLFNAWDLPCAEKQHYNPTARAFSDHYQITPAKFMRVFNAKMLNVWVDPIKEHANRFAYSNQRKLKPEMVRIIWECLPEIKQAQKDGIYNIVPWILQEGLNPHELKEKFGKSNWKKICKQSMTRNKMLAAGAKRFRYEGSIEQALTLPSYLLKKGGCTNFQWTQSTIWLIKNKQISSKHFVGKGLNTQAQIRLARTFEDTKRMAGELGKGFSSEWSIDKMKQKHAEYVHLVNLKRYSPIPYENLKDFIVKEVQHKGYVATLLDSAALVHQEGEAMHHCVGGYASSVAQGNYLVYSVTKDGKRSSTIAFRRWDNTEDWVFNQHYGYCNCYVENDDEKEFKDIILELLNSNIQKAA